MVCLLLVAAASASAGDAVTAEPLIWRLDQLQRIGGVAVETLGAPKLVDGAIHFDGSADGIFLPVNPLAGWKSFTVEVLFFPEGDGKSEQRFLHFQDSAGSRALLETRLNGHGGWAVDGYLHSAKHDRTLLDRSRVHPTDQWHWVALRYDGTTMSVFVNGEKQGEGPMIFPPMVEGRTSIGVRQNKLYWFKGTIREVRCTPAALSDAALQRVK